MYANDHDQQLPGQAPIKGLDTIGGLVVPQWPTLFCAYLSPNNPTVFVEPGDTDAAQLPVSEILSNVQNNTGFIYNGFDQLAVNNQPPSTVWLNHLTHQGDVVLLAQKKRGAKAFYVSPVFQPVTSLLDLLDPGAYEGGSHYLFVDGSVQYVKWEDYSNSFWLVDKGSTLPLPPLPPMPRGSSAYPGTASASLPLATVH